MVDSVSSNPINDESINNAALFSAQAVSDDDDEWEPPVSPTSLSSVGMGKVLILDRIFMLLGKMTESLQKVAASQAERLDFLAKWQQAYTDQMNQIHVFARNNGDTIDDPEESSTGNIRDDLNRVNSTYTEEMRSNRSIVSDDAKALQANVNQSNDAVEQQTNMATSIIQQFSTILSAIYR